MVPPLHRGNLSMNVKIINKIHIVIFRVLTALIQHGNHASGSADRVLLNADSPGSPHHCLLKCFYWTCWVVQDNIVSSKEYDKVTWIIKGDENFIMGMDEQCGLGSSGSNNKDSGGLKQYSFVHSFFPFLAARNVCQMIYFIPSQIRTENGSKRLQKTQAWTASRQLLHIKHS